jgi:hypothetical protein
MANPNTEALRAKTAKIAVKKLVEAKAALNDFLKACNDCGDGSGNESKGISDGRVCLMRDLSEYASYLEGRYA